MALEEVDKEIVLITAINGDDGIVKLSLMGADIPDFIFLDINMPRMNGLDCLRELGKMKFVNKPRIFMYSTAGTDRLRLQARELGAEDFIVKPSEITILTSILANIFISPKPDRGNTESKLTTA